MFCQCCITTCHPNLTVNEKQCVDTHSHKTLYGSVKNPTTKSMAEQLVGTDWEWLNKAESVLVLKVKHGWRTLMLTKRIRSTTPFIFKAELIENDWLRTQSKHQCACKMDSLSCRPLQKPLHRDDELTQKPLDDWPALGELVLYLNLQDISHQSHKCIFLNNKYSTLIKKYRASTSKQNIFI